MFKQCINFILPIAKMQVPFHNALFLPILIIITQTLYQKIKNISFFQINVNLVLVNTTLQIARF
jgi:hypothetical protein